MPKKKVLLIEDDEMLLDMYNLKFLESGFDVVKARNGLDGYESAKKNNPDIILLDIILPQMDGFAVMEKLKQNKNTKNIPVFFLTNLKQEEDVERGKKLGAAGYLVKATLTPTQILKKVKEFLKVK
ncbi:MAG: response regulator [Xanthomonadaceae bacterium]|nr:response regulator [Rhodospirillaceae bacterium]NIA18093.1 response regulator [Xanthomonadaceae bacterium]